MNSIVVRILLSVSNRSTNVKRADLETDHGLSLIQVRDNALDVNRLGARAFNYTWHAKGAPYQKAMNHTICESSLLILIFINNYKSRAIVWSVSVGCSVITMPWQSRPSLTVDVSLNVKVSHPYFLWQICWFLPSQFTDHNPTVFCTQYRIT